MIIMREHFGGSDHNLAMFSNVKKNGSREGLIGEESILSMLSVTMTRYLKVNIYQSWGRHSRT